MDVNEVRKNLTKIHSVSIFQGLFGKNSTPMTFDYNLDEVTYDVLLRIIDLYSRGEISFGKIVELGKMGSMAFLDELHKRGIKRDTGRNLKDIEEELTLL